MTHEPAELSATFISGYEKGHADGIAITTTLVHLAIDAWPNTHTVAHLLHGEQGKALELLIYEFGKRQYDKGGRDVKANQKKREEVKKKESAA